MSGVFAQMAAAHPSNAYQVPGGVELTQPASGSTESVPLPTGGRRHRRHSRRHNKTKRRTIHRRRQHRTRKH